MSEPHTSLNKLARVDQGQANERILRKQPRTDLTRVEGASIKYTTDLHSPDGKRFFARLFQSSARRWFCSFEIAFFGHYRRPCGLPAIIEKNNKN